MFFIKIISGPQEGLFHRMIDSFLTVGVRVKSGWTQLELVMGEEGGVYACNLGGGGRQARMGKGRNEEEASLHQSRQGQGPQGQVCACDPGVGGLQEQEQELQGRVL